MSDNVSVNDVLRGSSQSRHVDPMRLHDVMDDHGHEGQKAVRKAMNRLDGGRFREMLDSAHRLFAYADSVNREHFREMFGDDLMAWIGVYGRSQDLAWRFAVENDAGD